MKCKICNSSDITQSFSKTVLQKYTVNYFKCNFCGFLFTEEPYWLSEAYANAITSLDIGLLQRNLILLPVSKNIIRFYFNQKDRFLDYAGGYGVFTRFMRDSGFNYYREDVYCENLFAKKFDLEDLETSAKFELLTAFEVFEHLGNPIEEIRKMINYSSNILFTTEIQPLNSNPENWWYITPETGQHISFYSLKSLEILANEFGLNFTSNGTNIHIFSKNKISKTFFGLLTKNRFSKIIDIVLPSKPTLLMEDFYYIKKMMIS